MSGMSALYQFNKALREASQKRTESKSVTQPIASSVLESKQEASYIASYATTGSHSFIVITKKISTPDQVVHIVLASFGLYGESDCRFKSHISSSGLTSEYGCLRSEHFFLHDSTRSIYTKNFLISAEQAVALLRDVQRDATIHHQVNPTKSRKPFHEPEFFHALTPEEQELYQWFKQELNLNQRGGPRFSGFNFNCHQYAIHALRQIGIQDNYIESFSFPCDAKAPLFRADFLRNHSDEPCEPHWKKPPIISHVSEQYSFPESYYQMAWKYRDRTETTKALLSDYCSKGFSSQKTSSRGG